MSKTSLLDQYCLNVLNMYGTRIDVHRFIMLVGDVQVDPQYQHIRLQCLTQSVVSTSHAVEP